MSGIENQGEMERSLVAALRKGRQEALGKLYDAYAPFMMGVIIRIVQDKDVAEEVLKETFVAIWTRIGIYDASRERLLTWGLAIARGIALESVKTGRYNANGQSAAKPSESALQQNKFVTLQEDDIKAQDLCGLTPLQKTVLESLYLKGYSCAETAGKLRMTDEEIKEVLRSAFTHLKAGKSI